MAGTKYLAESGNFKIISSYEYVDLHFKNLKREEIYIGDFYGDPHCAIISGDEKYAVMAGCGIIIYRLQEPFEYFEYGKQTNQFTELYRTPPNHWWVNGLHQDNDIDQNWKYFRFVAANDEGVFIYKMNADTFEIENIGPRKAY